MKPFIRSYKLFLGVMVGLTLTACGQIQTEKVAPGTGLGTVDQSAILTGQDFQAACAAKGGYVNGSMCFTTLKYQNLGTNASQGYSETTLAALSGNAKLITEGSGPVEFYINNSHVATVPNDAFINQSGDLKLRLSPGSYSNVQIWVVQCFNQGMAVTNCP